LPHPTLCAAAPLAPPTSRCTSVYMSYILQTQLVIKFWHSTVNTGTGQKSWVYFHHTSLRWICRQVIVSQA
jgi:hypothetical protein